MSDITLDGIVAGLATMVFAAATLVWWFAALIVLTVRQLRGLATRKSTVFAGSLVLAAGSAACFGLAEWGPRRAADDISEVALVAVPLVAIVVTLLLWRRR